MLGAVAYAVSLDDEEQNRQDQRRLFVSGGLCKLTLTLTRSRTRTRTLTPTRTVTLALTLTLPLPLTRRAVQAGRDQ